MTKRVRLEFHPIPGYKGGEIALTICPPGTWMDNDQFLIFVGGCAVGKASNEAESEAVLHSRTIRELQYRVTNAEALVRHYTQELETFQRFGLRRRVPTPVETPEPSDTVLGIFGPFVERGLKAQEAVNRLGAGKKPKPAAKTKKKTATE